MLSGGESYVRLAPGWAEQEWLLKGEGVTLKENGCVDLKKYLWEC